MMNFTWKFSQEKDEMCVSKTETLKMLNAQEQDDGRLRRFIAL